jgi:hAT family C-terminal dimerisation region
MEEENFSTALIESYFQKAIDYVCQLYHQVIVAETSDQQAVSSGASSDKGSALNDKESCEDQQEDILVDDHMMALYQQMQDDYRSANEARLPDPEMKVKEFRELMERKMLEYRLNCSEMDMENWLDENGNIEYFLEKTKNPKYLKERLTIKDPGYTSKYFDVLKWWKLEGSVKYKELSVAANIVLGKPTHNGFQERVFSRGTYLRLKEENFEMSVLNSFNVKRIEDIKGALEDKETRTTTSWMTEKMSKQKQATELLSFYNRNYETVDGTVRLIRARDLPTQAESSAVASKKKVTVEDSDSDSDDSDIMFEMGAGTGMKNGDDDSISEFLTSGDFLNDEE